MASYMAGFNAKGRFNSAAYAMQTYTCRDMGPRQDVSNTEGIPGNPLVVTPAIGGEASIGGLDHLEANVKNATFDLLSNPFAAPFSFLAKTYISFLIWVNAVGGKSWAAPSFYLESVEMNGDVHGLQPVTFAGVSDGGYTVPA